MSPTPHLLTAASHFGCGGASSYRQRICSRPSTLNPNTQLSPYSIVLDPVKPSCRTLEIVPFYIPSSNPYRFLQEAPQRNPNRSLKGSLKGTPKTRTPRTPRPSVPSISSCWFGFKADNGLGLRGFWGLGVQGIVRVFAV